MKNWIKAGVVASVLLILVVGMSGCVSSPPTPTTAPTATPPVVTVTSVPTNDNRQPAPTAVPTDSNIKGIEANFVSASNGPPYTIVTHFTKTTVDGKAAYTGVVKDEDGYSFKVTIVLISTQSEAASYTDSLVSQYEAKGFTVKSDNGNHQYVLLKGSTTVAIAGYSVVYGTGSPGVAILERV
jgi:hypothetical protein